MPPKVKNEQPQAQPDQAELDPKIPYLDGTPEPDKEAGDGTPTPESEAENSTDIQAAPAPAPEPVLMYMPIEVTLPEPHPLDQLKAKLIDIGVKFTDNLSQGQTMNKEQIETLKALHELYTVLNVPPGI